MYELATGSTTQNFPSSRIEMLLAIYDECIDAVSSCLSRIREERLSEATLFSTRAIALVGLIRNGLDFSYGETPKRIGEVCHFIELCLLRLEPEDLEAVVRILTTFREAFAGIKEEATQLELQGEIPSLDISSFDTVA